MRVVWASLLGRAADNLFSQSGKRWKARGAAAAILQRSQQPSPAPLSRADTTRHRSRRARRVRGTLASGDRGRALTAGYWISLGSSSLPSPGGISHRRKQPEGATRRLLVKGAPLLASFFFSQMLQATMGQCKLTSTHAALLGPLWSMKSTS